jgi:hypothetical protein
MNLESAFLLIYYNGGSTNIGVVFIFSFDKCYAHPHRHHIHKPTHKKLEQQQRYYSHHKV